MISSKKLKLKKLIWSVNLKRMRRLSLLVYMTIFFPGFVSCFTGGGVRGNSGQCGHDEKRIFNTKSAKRPHN